MGLRELDLHTIVRCFRFQLTQLQWCLKAMAIVETI